LSGRADSPVPVTTTLATMQHRRYRKGLCTRIFRRLTPTAVQALERAAGQWPWDVGSNSPPLHRLSGLVDLADATGLNEQRQPRVGAFRHQNFVVAIDVWFGPRADQRVVDQVVSSITPG
jgi:hypothetical protein